MATPLSILLVEDSDDDAQLVLRQLAQGGYEPQAHRVQDKEGYLAALRQPSWDVVICDFNLPRFSAPEALELLHRSGLDLPFLVVSGTVGEDAAVQLMKLGAHDFVMKSSLKRLPAAVSRELQEAVHRWERRAADNELNKNEQRYRALIENLPGLVFVLHQGKIRYANPAAAKALGHGHTSALVGLTYLDLVHPQEREGVSQRLARVQSGESAAPAERRMLARTGAELVMEVQGQHIVYDGEPAALILGRDLTERRHLLGKVSQMQGSLERAHRQLELIVSSAGEGICGVDALGRTTFINPAAAEVLGWSPEELVGQSLHERIHPEGDDCKQGRCGLLATLGDGETRRITDESFLRKNGNPFPVEYVTTPIREEDRIEGAVVIFRDISERRQLQEQLFRAQKMEAVGQLAGGIAHDFNNIITAILSFSRFVRQDLGPDHPSASDMQEVETAAERAAALTRQLLAFSRRQVTEVRPIDLNELVQAAHGMLRRVIGEHIDLVTVTGKPLGMVKADRAQLDQVLLNLVVNARDALPDGGKLTIETADAELDGTYLRGQLGAKAGPYVMLAVSDTGVGMDKGTQAHIFEPFFTTKETGKGTGLGLATVYGIVEQAGGDIQVFSTPGKGTTFKLFFPRIEAEKVDRPKSGELVPVTGANETVLLVEDDEAVRAVARRALASAGYRVIEAASPDEALRICHEGQRPIQLLLTDVVMPQMGGPEVAARVRAVRPETKVLFMSGFPNGALMHQGMVPSATAYLQKPFTPALLVHRVRRTLDGKVESEA